MNTRFIRKILVAALPAAIISGSSPAAFATGNLWYDKYVTLDNTLGSNLYTSLDSGTLGWGESYILRSYISLYKTTKNTAWLDKFTTHVDTMLANVNDADGDGYDGWDTPFYSPYQVSNDSFETPASGDSTLPANWTRWQSTPSTAYRSNAANEKLTGSWGLVLKTNGSTWQRLYQNIADYEKSSKFTLRVNARTNGLVNGRVYVRDETANTLLGEIIITSPTWQYHTLSFMTPSVNGHTLRVWLSPATVTPSNGITYYDDVQFSGNYPYIVQDGMIGIPMAEFVQLVNQTSILQTAYLAKANAYQTFLQNEMVPKWTNSTYLGNCWNQITSSKGSYTQPPNLSTLDNDFPGRNLAYNMSLAFGHMMGILYTVNGDPGYLGKANQTNRYFYDALSLAGSAYDWNYGEFSTAREDVIHALVDLGAAFDRYRGGATIYSGADMWRFKQTLTSVMWNGSLTAPTVTYYVNGAGNTGSSKSLSNWLELSQFDNTVWKIAAEQYRNYTPDTAGRMLTLAQIVAWDPVKVVNQGFELLTYNDSTLPARWLRFQSSSTTAYMDSANKSTGSFGATIKANGASWQKLYQSWTEWAPSTSYTITFDGKTDGSAAGGRVAVTNETTGISLGGLSFFDTGWVTNSFTFTTPPVGTNSIRVYLGNHDYAIANGKAHFDNVVIKRTGDSF